MKPLKLEIPDQDDGVAPESSTATSESSKRGRPCVGKVAMSAAERKKRSRAKQREMGFGDYQKRIPKPFSCDLDEVVLLKLRRAAEIEGVPIYAILERLVHVNL